MLNSTSASACHSNGSVGDTYPSSATSRWRPRSVDERLQVVGERSRARDREKRIRDDCPHPLEHGHEIERILPRFERPEGDDHRPVGGHPGHRRRRGRAARREGGGRTHDREFLGRDAGDLEPAGEIGTDDHVARGQRFQARSIVRNTALSTLPYPGPKLAMDSEWITGTRPVSARRDPTDDPGLGLVGDEQIRRVVPQSTAGGEHRTHVEMRARRSHEMAVHHDRYREVVAGQFEIGVVADDDEVLGVRERGDKITQPLFGSSAAGSASRTWSTRSGR